MDTTSDPSLTPQQLFREIAALKELMNQRVGANERAVDVAHADLVRVPTAVDKAVATLRDLVMERFSRIELQFHERDVRFDQASADRAKAVDAALASAREASTKQNEYFKSTIDKSEEATNAAITALRLKLAELQDRMNLDQGRDSGVKSGWGYLVGGVSLIATFIGAVATIYVFRNPTPPVTVAAAPAPVAAPAPSPQVIIVPGIAPAPAAAVSPSSTTTTTTKP